MRTTASDQLAERREELKSAPALRRLAARLRALVDPLTAGDVYLPEAKPLLSRDGGVCAADGARLSFDPRSPEAHACPACGAVYRGERHHRAWIWRYHLWLSERAIHLALLSVLLDEPALGERASRILERYADLYPTVPNKDNVLGPTRLFFSTYLESLWLTQVIIAGLLLRSGPLASPVASVLDGVVEESAGLIASFDEGRSNRQVWHATALLAAAGWTDDRALAERSLARLRGLVREGVSTSGLWHEGENYHFFALRAFALAGELARWGGHAFPSLAPMYEAPLDTLLPDLTLPARGDAPYAVSVVQPRFADLWELGRRRTTSDRLEALLAALYALDLPEGEDWGFEDIAEQEVNRPPGRVGRDRLSWKALLWMHPEPPRGVIDWRGMSKVLTDAGVVVLRPARDAYVSVECAGPRGGHGHPDALHVSAFFGRPLLADFGTASYVSPSLHWYRSTLAHNAPAPAGRDQLGGTAWCAALDERDEWSWCQCEAQGICGPETSVRRSVVTGRDWVLDVVDVTAPTAATIDLPIHALEEAHGPVLAPREGETVRVESGPGPPTPWFADGTPLNFLVRRAGGSGRWVQALFREPGGQVAFEGEEIVIQTAEPLWIDVRAGAATVRRARGAATRLLGVQPPPERPQPPALPDLPLIVAPLLEELPDLGQVFDLVPHDAIVVLEREAYRRSEAAYGERGPFRAECVWTAAGNRLVCAVRVSKSALTFRPAGTADPQLDNEAPDIHSDGVQVYVGTDAWRGWVAVPAPDGTVRVRPVAGTAAEPREAEARWERRADGYAIMVRVEMPRTLERGDRVAANVVVNEMYPDRDRRAGQLALAGGGWVYLRGDREPPMSGAVLEIA